MSTNLGHYNNRFSLNSELEWDGLRSSKFGKTKAILVSKDLISTGLEFPDQRSISGRKYYEQRLSPQHQFRPIVRIIPKIDHWHPRESRKKVSTMQFTNPHTRRQKGHNLPQLPLTQRGTAGIRTFYNTKVRDSNIKEYSVEDRMQRKTRIDQLQLRKTFFLKQNQSINHSMY